MNVIAFAWGVFALALGVFWMFSAGSSSRGTGRAAAIHFVPGILLASMGVFALYTEITEFYR